MTIALTGHRPPKLGGEWDGVGPVSDWIRKKLRQHIMALQPDAGISGMALGADMIWAEVLLELRIPLIAAVPVPGQEAKWSQASKDRYRSILDRAQQVVYVSTGVYHNWMMQKRNEWMVDNADTLIAISDGSPGGTQNCINYARKKWRDNTNRIIIINPNRRL